MEKNNIVNSKDPEITEIFYKASHDLKGPLRTIKSFTQLLNESLSERFTNEEKGLVNFIQEATDNLENLIVKLIDYSKAGLPSNIREIKIDNLLQLMVLENKKKIDEKNATVNISCQDDFMLNVDKNKFIILLENLLSNSLKFSKKNNSPEINIKVIENPSDFKIDFIDNGIGIAKDKLCNAFTLLEKIHGTNEYEGAGIGLATCKRIIESHGGTIDISSELGKFTEISFTIPKNIEL